MMMMMMMMTVLPPCEFGPVYRRQQANAIVLSCLAINVVPERDEASVCNAVVKFVREHLSSCCEKIVFCCAAIETGARGERRRGGGCVLFWK